ncbi:hypothetical protein NUW58_g9626 [Xylaria curta]|uniref:Uncharacterized protein n=1 Tax=Xylaria curta TaxID=42375 RepID=A0ACC1MVH7_9PEZI|nr:hypothetical protein NUW58_g9626 [Xylaria curta]
MWPNGLVSNTSLPGNPNHSYDHIIPFLEAVLPEHITNKMVKAHQALTHNYLTLGQFFLLAMSWTHYKAKPGEHLSFGEQLGTQHVVLLPALLGMAIYERYRRGYITLNTL